jgi:hypothetical protein
VFWHGDLRCIQEIETVQREIGLQMIDPANEGSAPERREQSQKPHAHNRRAAPG